MSETPPKIQIQFTPEFNRKYKALKKRYRNIQSDLQPVLEALQSGEVLGDQIPGLDVIVMKLRVKNSDIQKGKSGGYRLIYWTIIDETLLLLDIYSKSDQVELDFGEIRRVIKKYREAHEEGNSEIP
ncbi:type II toxin-antitoxin system RelE/ParE family toxin [Alkalinema pantanalense CENA528]|uniref:type II toxin-antitoxin system RelE/ParE family toxin n=1 Tax=Alkalinema pantanalense TaxID=1620705 RepID=UPI003D6DD591